MRPRSPSIRPRSAPGATPAGRRSHARPRRALLWLLAALSLVLATACAAVGGPTVQPTAQSTAGQQAAAQPTAQAATSAPTAQTTTSPGARAGGFQSPAELVYQRNSGSVVNINSVAVVPTQFGVPQQQRGTGSGFVLDDQGHIVTNNHVVQDAAQLTVAFADANHTVVPATLVGRDPDNDLAVIRVDPNATTADGTQIRPLLKAATLGDSDQIKIGEYAIAIGSPLGLQQSVTAGIISAIRLPGEEPATELELLGGAIQTDAAINPGNSGGPLFNAAGDVIGVNTAILSPSGGNIGVGFAIPINVVKRVVPELIQSGCYRHPLIGVTTISLSRLGQAAKQQLGIPANQSGLLVQEVSAGAAQANVEPGNRVVNLGGVQIRVGGDIITAVDNQPVSTGGDLRAYIENTKRPGDTVTLTLLDNGQREQITVTLSERPSEACRTAPAAGQPGAQPAGRPAGR